MSQEILQTPKLGLPRMLLLGAASIILCLSYLMAIFTPFPIAMGVVLYGRLRGYGMLLVSLGICITLGAFGIIDYALAGSYALFAVFAAVIAETLNFNWRPVRSLVITGLVFLSAMVGTSATYLQLEKKALLQVVEQDIVAVAIQRFEEAKKAGAIKQDLAELGLARPAAEIAGELLKVVPGYLVMGIFFVLWVNTYLTLKARRLMQPAQKHQFDETTLLSFKMPFAGIYVVVAALLLATWGEKLDPQWGEVLGMVLLQSVGVFYFFQGFGVALGFLNHFQIVGFFRTLFVMSVVFFVPWALAVLGLFDTWFDFNNKFKKQVSN